MIFIVIGGVLLVVMIVSVSIGFLTEKKRVH